MKPIRMDELMKFRIPRALKSRLARIGNARFKSLPEISREALAQFVERAEKESSPPEKTTT